MTSAINEERRKDAWRLRMGAVGQGSDPMESKAGSSPGTQTSSARHLDQERAAR